MAYILAAWDAVHGTDRLGHYLEVTGERGGESGRDEPLTDVPLT